MTKRIFRSIFAVAAVVLLLSLSVVLGVLYDHYSDLQWRQLESALELTRLGVEAFGKDYLCSIPTEDLRITWVDRSGMV
ncbi:MAG: two-component sensor histidine kinase, partial [Oscillospiraceae bacterium]|nr:two-component sensor histidine kinase [Oscillospiraceae bacterium]